MNTCRRGHPLTQENVYVYGTKRQCRTCKLASVSRYRSKQKQASDMQLRLWFPAEPLLKLIEVEAKRRESGRWHLLKSFGLNGSAVNQEKFHYVTVDRICVALRYHPAEVYPEWAEEAA